MEVVIIEPLEFPTDADLSRRFGLSRRECEVARLLADRLTGKEIAERLGISPHTARRHSEHVLWKLEINSRRDVQAVLLGPVSYQGGTSLDTLPERGPGESSPGPGP